MNGEPVSYDLTPADPYPGWQQRRIISATIDIARQLGISTEWAYCYDAARWPEPLSCHDLDTLPADFFD